MNLVTRILANKFVALAILFGAGVYLLIVPGLTNQLGANPIERLLHVSGEIAIWTLGAVLSQLRCAYSFRVRRLSTR